MRAQATGGDDFEIIPSGITFGRCFKVVDLGTQEYIWKGSAKYVRQIFVSFELPKYRIEIEGEDLPRAISKKYTLSFSSKANLRNDMEQWYGKKFNDKDIENSGGFDPEKILGRPAQINVIHSDDGKYANIGALLPLAPGQEALPQENPSFIFDLDAFDQTKWDTLSEKMQDWIAASPEMKQILGRGQGQQAQPAQIDDGFDDIPF